MSAPRMCVKLHATSDSLADAALVPVFQEWIRDRTVDGVLLDVADYTHVPDGPGMVLVAHGVSYALDRSDGRLGLVVQQRRPIDGDVADAVESAVRGAFDVAGKLEAEPALNGTLAFDRSTWRVEANDRLRAPNTDAAFEALRPAVLAAAQRVISGETAVVSRARNDQRDRLAFVVHVGARHGP